jgi:hypothetical protein
MAKNSYIVSHFSSKRSIPFPKTQNRNYLYSIEGHIQMFEMFFHSTAKKMNTCRQETVLDGARKAGNAMGWAGQESRSIRSGQAAQIAIRFPAPFYTDATTLPWREASNSSPKSPATPRSGSVHDYGDEHRPQPPHPRRCTPTSPPGTPTPRGP